MGRPFFLQGIHRPQTPKHCKRLVFLGLTRPFGAAWVTKLSSATP